MLLFLKGTYMKKYIVLTIAALTAFGQSIQGAEITNVRQMWQWNFPSDLYEVIEDLELQIERLTVIGAPACEIIPLQKAALDLKMDAFESEMDVFDSKLDAIEAIFKRSYLKVGPAIFASSGVGAMIGLGLFCRGLHEAYDAYYDKECISKKTTIASNLGLAAVGAVMVGALAPIVYEALNA